MPTSVTVSVPEFVIVEVCAAVAPSLMSREPNASVAGLRVSSVWIPVPESAIVSSGPFESIVASPVCAPVADGSKAIRRLHSSPTASVSSVAQSPTAPVRRVQPLSTVIAAKVTGRCPCSR